MECLDVLIVDELGKNISGTGMDPNVTGFWRRFGGPRTPDYRTIVVLDLTDASDGNAVGIGMAELTTRRVMDKIDIQKTYTNSIASGIFSSAKMPIALENDRAAVETALGAVPVLEKVAPGPHKEHPHAGDLLGLAGPFARLAPVGQRGD